MVDVLFCFVSDDSNLFELWLEFIKLLGIWVNFLNWDWVFGDWCFLEICEIVVMKGEFEKNLVVFLVSGGEVVIELVGFVVKFGVDEIVFFLWDVVVDEVVLVVICVDVLFVFNLLEVNGFDVLVDIVIGGEVFELWVVVWEVLVCVRLIKVVDELWVVVFIGICVEW